MKKIKHIIAAFLLFVVTVIPVSVSATSLTQFGAAPLAVPCVNKPILTIPSWYKGLQCDGVQPRITKLNDIWVIALNVVESLIAVTAYVAVGFIIWGGIKYIKSQGEPGQLTEAKTTILQAVIGLAVALASTAIVLFVQGRFT